MNAVAIEEAITDLALQPFDAVEFPFTFLAAFGNKDAALKRLRSGNNTSENLRRADMNPAGAHLHRPPFQERYRAAGKAV